VNETVVLKIFWSRLKQHLQWMNVFLVAAHQGCPE